MTREGNTISVEKRLFDEFIEKAHDLELAQEVAHIGSWHLHVSDTGSKLTWSHETYRIFGLEEDSGMNYERFLSFIHPEDRSKLDAEWKAAMLGSTYDIEHRIVRPDGEIRYVREKASMRFEKGAFVYAIGTVQDVTERRKSQEEINLFKRIFYEAREGMFITDTDANILLANPAFENMTGYPLHEIVGQNPRILKSERQPPDFYRDLWEEIIRKGRWQGEIWNRRKNGETYPEVLGISAIRDSSGKITNYIAVFSDITKMKETEQRLTRLAHYDEMTDLPNRNLVLERIAQGIGRANLEGGSFAVCYVDIDAFKSVNDHYGNDAGDELIRQMAKRILSVTRPGDTVARIAGDEFVMLFENVTGRDDVWHLAEHVLSQLRKPFFLNGIRIETTASIGVTTFPEDPVEAEQLLRHADQAMYFAKEGGKNRVQFFDTERHYRAQSKNEAANRIRLGLEREEFELHYQPKIRLSDGSVVGFEALSRWRTQEGIASPAKFIPIVEEDAELATEFGEWAVRAALTQMSVWQSEGVDFGTVAVNVSAKHLQNSSFERWLASLLDEFREIDPAKLELELVETAALDNFDETVRTMNECLMMGISFDIDDFGTGYSSLAYLKRLRASTLKIDQSFVRDMLENPDDLNIVEGILGLAIAFQKNVVAEGVETFGQAEMLHAMGCETGQGYVFSRPMESKAVSEWLVSYRKNPVRFGRSDGLAPFRETFRHADILKAKNYVYEWTSRVEAQIQKHMFSVIDAPTKCRFDAWYEGEGRDKYSNRPWFAELDEAHRELHAIVHRMSEFGMSNQFEAYGKESGVFEAAKKRLLDMLSDAFRLECGKPSVP